MGSSGKRVNPFPKRGSVYLVRFDPTEGSEIKKTHPAMIIQNDIGNRFSNVTIVAAITSRFQLPCIVPTCSSKRPRLDSRLTPLSASIRFGLSIKAVF